MKKEYLRPTCEIIGFEVKETLMGEVGVGGTSGFVEGDEDW